jgi:hypothetical protein
VLPPPLPLLTLGRHADNGRSDAADPAGNDEGAGCGVKSVIFTSGAEKRYAMASDFGGAPATVAAAAVTAAVGLLSWTAGAPRGVEPGSHARPLTGAPVSIKSELPPPSSSSPLFEAAASSAPSLVRPSRRLRAQLAAITAATLRAAPAADASNFRQAVYWSGWQVNTAGDASTAKRS